MQSSSSTSIDPLIQCLVRWKTAASVHIYGRLNPQEYADWMRRAARAETNSLQVQRLPVYDADEAHLSIAETAHVVTTEVIEDVCEAPTDSDAEQTTPAAPPRTPVARSTEQNCNDSIQMDTPISIVQANPKRPASKSWARYEASKQATSKRQYLALGGTTADFKHDLNKAFINVA